MKLQTRILAGLTLLAALVATSSPTLAANTAAENKAQRLIQKNAKALSDFSYPTTTYTHWEYVKGTRYKDGSFLLTYRLHQKSGNNRGYCTLSFAFRRSGKMTSISTKGPRTHLLAPFTTARLLVLLMKKAIQDDPRLRNNRLAQEFVRKGEVVKFLILILNLENGYV